MVKVHKLTVGTMQSNCYIVEEYPYCLIVDPGDEADFITQKINELRLKPVKILATHGHFDHNMAVFELTSNFDIPFFIDKEDISLIKNIGNSSSLWLKRDDVVIPKTQIFNKSNISINNKRLKIIKIPGHTPGSVAFYFKSGNFLISGDLIFKGGGLGRTDFSYSNKDKFSNSLKKILRLPNDTLIYPGHGENFLLSEYVDS